jgi:hypothetical protein
VERIWKNICDPFHVTTDKWKLRHRALTVAMQVMPSMGTLRFGVTLAKPRVGRAASLHLFLAGTQRSFKGLQRPCGDLSEVSWPGKGSLGARARIRTF